MRLGFVGTGEITSSMVTGLNLSGDGTHAIRLSPRNAEMANRLVSRFRGVTVASGNQDVLEHSEVVVIAVRPSIARAVLSELRFRPDHYVISLVSGLSLQSLVELVSPAIQMVRAVPLPSTANRLSPTAIYPPDPVASTLFATLGTVFPVESEKEFNAICAATATVASYFAFNETIASWLERQGISATQARDYIGRLFLGVTTEAIENSGRSFQSLSAGHTTAGGVNEQFLRYMSERGLLTNVAQALDAVLRRIEAKP